MIYISIQLSTFFYIIPLIELGKSDYVSAAYGFYQIPWEDMRILFGETQLDYSSQTKHYDKLIVDLVTTHLVYELKLKPVAASGSIDNSSRVETDDLVRDKINACRRKSSSEGSMAYGCMYVSRKMIIHDKPIGTTIEIYGREVLVENYAGCYESKTSSSSMTVNEYKVDKTDSARECAVKCRGKSGYYSLNSEEECVCIADMSVFMSVNSTLCGNCTNTLYTCGRQTFLAMYTTKDVRANRLEHPAPYSCLDLNRCGVCDDGRKGHNCEYIDCSEHNGSCRRKCSSFTIRNEKFGFCTCPDGYLGEESSCEDYNECEEEHACDENQICVNTAGSFTCTCRVGYLRNEVGKCSDDDECKYATSCPEDQICINIPGSFKCDCNLGYKKDELLNCIDVDECLFACGDGGQICTNTVGSYTCRCVSGYVVGESGKCLDIDECRTINSCNNSSTVCSNIEGSYICRCLTGFRYHSLTACEDIDECEDMGCDITSAECINLRGSFLCACLRGYHKMDSFQCADVNECDHPAIRCPDGVPCINLPGSFDCVCPDGSIKTEYGHNTQCDDVDECEVPNICDATSSFCLNTRPLYVCLCRKGYASVDNFTCVPYDIDVTEETTTVLTTVYAGEDYDNLDPFDISLGLMILSLIFVIFILVYFLGSHRSMNVGSRRDSTATSVTNVSSMSR